MHLPWSQTVSKTIIPHATTPPLSNFKMPGLRSFSEDPETLSVEIGRPFGHVSTEKPFGRFHHTHGSRGESAAYAA